MYSKLHFDLSDLYDQDIIAWYSEAIEFIDNGRMDLLDPDQLKEVLTFLSQQERLTAFRSALRILKLLLRYQVASISLELSDLETQLHFARIELSSDLERSRILYEYVNEHLALAYANARQDVIFKYRVSRLLLAEKNPYTLQQVLDQEYFPARKP
jgi:hypothetical protein